MLDELCGTHAVLLLLPAELALDERLDQAPASAGAAVEERDRRGERRLGVGVLAETTGDVE